MLPAEQLLLRWIVLWTLRRKLCGSVRPVLQPVRRENELRTAEPVHSGSKLPVCVPERQVRPRYAAEEFRILRLKRGGKNELGGRGFIVGFE